MAWVLFAQQNTVKTANLNSIINFYFVTCFYSLYDICMVDKKTFLMTDWGEGFYFIYSYMKIGNEFNIATLLLGFTNSEICLLNIAN